MNEVDIQQILSHHMQAAPLSENKTANSDIGKLTAFYRNRMLALGYDDRDKASHEAIAAWCANRWAGCTTRGLILRGVNGNGKTSAARLISRFFGTKFVWAPEVIGWWLDDAETPWLEKTLPEPCMFDKPRPNADLIIDEVGRGDEDGDHCAVRYGQRCRVIGELLARRYDQWKQSRHTALTIITTNLSDLQIREWYGIHVLDRLNEMTERIEFTGGSRRRDWKKDKA